MTALFYLLKVVFATAVVDIHFLVPLPSFTNITPKYLSYCGLNISSFSPVIAVFKHFVSYFDSFSNLV